MSVVTKRTDSLKKLFVFDLDGTLAESKSCLSLPMAQLLVDLLDVMKVAVISGGSWAQFETQLLANLPTGEHLRNLSLLPTCGTRFYEYDDGWSLLYAEDLSAEERSLIVSSLTKALEESGLAQSKVWGEVIEDRHSQITLSALGQDAPLAEKAKWDPDFTKRKKIASILEPLLSNFEVRFGGTTSIDVTKRGIDKAYGVAKLRERLAISLGEMIFAGDALFKGGNDFPVQEMGVDSLLVTGPPQTQLVIQTVIACVGDSALVKAPPKTLS